MARDLILEQREEPAIGGDPVGAERDKLARAVAERVEQTVRALPHDALRRRALDHLVEHRERPSLGVAHVARNARKARLQHQDAEPRAVDRLPAEGDAVVVELVTHRICCPHGPRGGPPTLSKLKLHQ